MTGSPYPSDRDGGPSGHGLDHGALPRRLADLLDRQLGLYGQLDGLSQAQRGLIDDDEAEQLLDLLRQREFLVEQILRVNAELDPLLGHWERDRLTAGAATRTEIARRVESVQALAESVANRDDADRQALQRRRDAVADQLGSIGRGRGAVQAYGSGAPAARYQDREG
ncbi:MAG: flagellar export chaperone FlgN [Planctomycetota bacterium]